MNKPIGSYIYKTAKISRAATDGSGFIEGYLATYDVDRDAEKFAAGSFTQSVVEWTLSGDMPPLLLNHERDPDAILGRVEWMLEDVTGLKIGAQLDLENETSQKAYEALLVGRLDKLSIGFIGYKWTYEDDVRVWTRAEILEASLTPVPSNPQARVTVVKSADPDRRVKVQIAGETVEVDAQVARWLQEDERVSLKAQTDAQYWKRLIDDAAAGKNIERPPVDVDAFILETQQMMVEEKLAEAEQAAWEERMDINAVLEPVPVRVDARMRPDR